MSFPLFFFVIISFSNDFLINFQMDMLTCLIFIKTKQGSQCTVDVDFANIVYLVETWVKESPPLFNIIFWL